MIRFFLGGMLLVAAMAMTAKAEEKAAAKFDPAKMVGKWEYVSGVRAGDKVDKDRLGAAVTFTKDMITVPAGDGKFLMKYKIDAKASPATIDMEIKDGPVKEGKALGIVEIKDGQLKLCYVSVSGDDDKRPTKFESTKENKAFYFVLKRAK
jgi:uncharacterized protein (TIGR03067 family)